MINDGHGFLDKCRESLFDRFSVVVGPTARLCAFEQPLLHHFLAAVEEEDEIALHDLKDIRR